MATDFSPVALHAQQHFAGLAAQSMFVEWSSFVKGSPPIENSGRFDVAEPDFVACPPSGVFDVVINCRAFQGSRINQLESSAAQEPFFGKLRNIVRR